MHQNLYIPGHKPSNMEIVYTSKGIYNADFETYFVEPSVNESTNISYSLLEPLQTALVSSITPVQIVTVLVAIIGVGMTFVLMCFGVRKLMKIFKKALNGKISF